MPKACGSEDETVVVCGKKYGTGRVGAAHVSGEGQVFVVSAAVYFGWYG